MRRQRRWGIGLALSAAVLVACAQQPPDAPAGGNPSRGVTEEAKRYVAALRWAAGRSAPAARAIHLRGTRGGPRGERIARSWPAALRAEIRRQSGGRPRIRFGGRAATTGELDLTASTFGRRDSEWFVRIAAFDAQKRRWSREVRVLRRDGRWVGRGGSP